jgi:hypothetical protein
MVIAADRRQARVIMRYVKGLLNAVPMLKATILVETAESIELRNSVIIEVHTASFRTVRGYTVVAALCDEIAFWRSDESANPDSEIIAALRPAMATISGAMLLCASSPYARNGALWQAHRKHYGNDGDEVLVWQAPTRTMNPSVPHSVIDAAYSDDPESAAAEWGAEFRRDIETYISREAVKACVEVGCHERAPVSGVRYVGFIDPSGGSSDSMAVAIAHCEGDVAVLDAVRERKPPFSPADVVAEFAATLNSYRVSKVCGDRYAGEWPREQFRTLGISYEVATKPKNDLYRDLLPGLNSGKCSLLDHPRLVAQLLGLERRTARGGRDSIDHAPGAHDDIANATAGALVEVAAPRSNYTEALMRAVGRGAGRESYAFRMHRQTGTLLGR